MSLKAGQSFTRALKYRGRETDSGPAMTDGGPAMMGHVATYERRQGNEITIRHLSLSLSLSLFLSLSLSLSLCL